MDASGGDQASIYSIEELAQLGGVTRRTVRYYVQRGLIPPPTGTGRGKHYTQGHLDALLRVKALQEQGVALAEIVEPEDDEGGGAAPRAAPGPQPIPTPAAEVWLRVPLGEGIELHLRSPSRALESTVVDALRRAVVSVLDRDGKGT